MHWLKKLFGYRVAETTRESSVPASFSQAPAQSKISIDVIEHFSDRDRDIIQRAYSGEINEESLVDELLEIERKTYMLCISAVKSGICGVSCAFPEPKLVKNGTVLSCPNCGRVFQPDAFNDKYKNKLVVAIGEALSRRGGLSSCN